MIPIPIRCECCGQVLLHATDICPNCPPGASSDTASPYSEIPNLRRQLADAKAEIARLEAALAQTDYNWPTSTRTYKQS